MINELFARFRSEQWRSYINELLNTYIFFVVKSWTSEIRDVLQEKELMNIIFITESPVVIPLMSVWQRGNQRRLVDVKLFN